jgi:AraC-like DNA-binding protein
MQNIFMKPLLEKVPKGNFSFYIKREAVPYFVFPWHNHPEVEIIHVEEGTGTRFVGDHIERFENDDLVMTGQFLPHRWKSDDKYYSDKKLLSVSKVIHFSEKAFGTDFLSLPEMQNVARILKESTLGIKPYGSLKTSLIDSMNQMYHDKKLNKIGLLINMLEDIAQSQEYDVLSSQGFVECINIKDDIRLNKVFEYVMNNFTNDLEFKNIAEIANMSEAAFSRYFKKHTGKTFSVYINDLRIGYACKLLLGGQLNVTQAAFECGFNNLSYFNEQFKKYTGKTPREYSNTHK